MPVSASAALSAYAAAANAAPAAGAAGTAGAAGAPGTSFADVLGQALQETVQTARAGEQAMLDHAAGKAELVDVVTAISAAEVALETVVAVRDRVIAAYQDIMKMPI